MPAIVASGIAVPNTLFPPTGKFVPVTVSGNIRSLIAGTTRISGQPVTSPSFQVVDEYRRIEPQGPLVLHPRPNGSFDYSFTINLQASRANEYPAGRRYWIIVAAQDKDGFGGAIVHVQVPHSLTQRGTPPEKVPTGKHTGLPPVFEPPKKQNNPFGFLQKLLPGAHK